MAANASEDMDTGKFGYFWVFEDKTLLRPLNGKDGLGFEGVHRSQRFLRGSFSCAFLSVRWMNLSYLF